uniref:Uncharacterized protein n=1 Tax=Romanomermis culicivorax TaxID=13658 RepID=A0A915KN55_ROMCU
MVFVGLIFTKFEVEVAAVATLNVTPPSNFMEDQGPPVMRQLFLPFGASCASAHLGGFHDALTNVGSCGQVRNGPLNQNMQNSETQCSDPQYSEVSEQIPKIAIFEKSCL